MARRRLRTERRLAFTVKMGISGPPVAGVRGPCSPPALLDAEGRRVAARWLRTKRFVESMVSGGGPCRLAGGEGR